MKRFALVFCLFFVCLSVAQYLLDGAGPSWWALHDQPSRRLSSFLSARETSGNPSWRRLDGSAAGHLVFLHIPGTGSGSIEDKAREHAAAHPEEAAAVHWGVLDPALACHQATTAGARRCQLQPSGECPVWLVPPAADETVAKYYAAGDSFCVVRHPLERFFQQWRSHKTSKGLPGCWNEEYAFWALSVLDMIAESPNAKDCSFRPQRDYVFGANGERLCQHVLHFENLTSEFEALTRSRGLNLALPANATKDSAEECRLDLPPGLRKRFYEAFKGDFEAFGYPAPDATAPREALALASAEEAATHQLKFVHIPKTGGTSIEAVGKAYHMRTAKRHQSALWGINDRGLQCAKYAGSRSSRACQLTPEPGTCMIWHTPPKTDGKLAAYYDAKPHRTFCVVRDPVHRMLSEWEYLNTMAGKWVCDQHTYETWIDEALEKYKHNPNVYGCHMRPQVDFVLDGNGHQVCHHVIRFENMTAEFKALMHSYNMNMELTTHSMPNVDRLRGKSHGPCKLSTPEHMVRRVREAYRLDFEVFGY